jgi:hypothetical protein
MSLNTLLLFILPNAIPVSVVSAVQRQAVRVV